MAEKENLIEELQQGILSWYPFKTDASILYIGADDAVSRYLVEQYWKVTMKSGLELAESEVHDNNILYDYVVIIRGIEQSENPKAMLQVAYSLLKEDGRLLLVVENRLGLRYFCGDREPFSNRVFDGIENYTRSGNRVQSIQKSGGRLYSRQETSTFLKEAGFENYKIYSVLPSIEAPQIIYAEDTLPNEELAIRLTPYYHDPFAVFLREEQLYTDLAKNGMFHHLANAWLMECPKDSTAELDYAIRQVTLSTDRGKESACATIIRRDWKVEKKATYPEGQDRLQVIIDNTNDLAAHGVPVVPMEKTDRGLIMPFIHEESAIMYMQRLLVENTDEFIRLMDQLRDTIMNSSEIVEDGPLGPILRKGYVDLVLHNAFWKNHRFEFIDQEFFEENYPANAIVFRNIAMIYDGDQTREQILPSSYFWKKYDMERMFHVWVALARNFAINLRNEASMIEFNASHTIVSGWHIPFNRKKIDEWGYDEWQLRDTCFDNLDGKRIYLYGAGAVADKFLAFYHREIKVDCIYDDNAYIWNSEKRGVRIDDPNLLNAMNPDEYKVIISARDFRPIYEHLRTIGVKNIGLYDADYVYPGRQKLAVVHDGRKKYRIGYLAGVFDLVHYGHLRMFQRAKEQCDYLVVGVVMDEGVRLGKNKEPYIPFEERIQMVQAMEDVDEAVEIPYDYPGTVEAFQKYHFDVQFSGSDYVDHPWWLEQQQYLRDHGADLVFYSYTEQTSSTKIRALIEKGMDEN